MQTNSISTQYVPIYKSWDTTGQTTHALSDEQGSPPPMQWCWCMSWSCTLLADELYIEVFFGKTVHYDINIKPYYILVQSQLDGFSTFWNSVKAAPLLKNEWCQWRYSSILALFSMSLGYQWSGRLNFFTKYVMIAELYVLQMLYLSR